MKDVDAASAAEQGYRTPPPAIADLVAAPETPEVVPAPGGRHLLLLERPALPPVALLAAPELRLAGVRLNPRTNGHSRAYFAERLVLLDVEGADQRAIEGLPQGALIDDVQWAPDGSRFAFSVGLVDGDPGDSGDAGGVAGSGVTPSEPEATPGLQLWVADVATATAVPLDGVRLNGAFGAPFQWLPDGQALVCTTIPAGRGAPPPLRAPLGPSIRETSGRRTAARTYQDLLRSPHDERLFEYYFAAQVVRAGLDGSLVPLGAPGLIRRARPSPDGRHVLVETVHRPYSYLVPHHRFPHRVEVWDGAGRVLRQLADLPLLEDVPPVFAAVPAGPRLFGWRADAPATVYWLEAQDGGDPRVDAAERDRLYTLDAPFGGAPRPLLSLALRFQRVLWGTSDVALVGEYWWTTRRERTWIVQPDAPPDAGPGGAPRLLWDRSSEDRYGHPGTPLLYPLASGYQALLRPGGGDALLLAGAGASPEGDRPFLDRLDLRTLQTERLWRSEAPAYEQPVATLDPDGRCLVTRRESPSEAPDYWVRSLDGGTLRRLTRFPHPWPEFSRAHKELIRYQREDGVQLTATLYLPPGYSPADGPLPALLWAYPREFKSASAAGQVTDSPYRFPRLSWRSPLFWLTQGFAVLDGPTMPIVGEGEAEPNDTYVAQLVASARAAVEELVRRGVADRRRIAVGGHSYGGFMTANLLAHSDLFCAGIARSGAYNRTLTPFGFQAEERTLWQAPEVYAAMSPFVHADKIKTPLLLVHGEADDNPGTFPIQSERLYNAIAGHGGTARLVILPHEGHAYRARESVLHMLWEMTEWLNRYAGSAESSGSAGSAGSAGQEVTSRTQ